MRAAFSFAMILAAVRVAAAAESPPLSIGELLAQGWEIAGYASGYDNRSHSFCSGIRKELSHPVLDPVRRDPQSAHDRQLLRAALIGPGRAPFLIPGGPQVCPVSGDARWRDDAGFPIARFAAVGIDSQANVEATASAAFCARRRRSRRAAAAAGFCVLRSRPRRGARCHGRETEARRRSRVHRRGQARAPREPANGRRWPPWRCRRSGGIARHGP